MLLFHIVAGALGILSGTVALYSPKGGRLHRRSGKVFVCTMLAMCATGAVMAVAYGAGPAVNLPAALTAAYLVVTALTTVRPRDEAARRIDVVAMRAGTIVGAGSILGGIFAATRGGPEAGMAFPAFMFAAIGLLGSAADRRMLRTNGLQGANRIRRHLWRMCAALLIAAASFFLGQADELPRAMRPFSGLPVLAIIVTLVYWLRRVRRQKPPAVRPPDTAMTGSLLPNG